MMGPIRANLRYSLHPQGWTLEAGSGTEELLGFGTEEFLGGHLRLEERIHPGDSEIAGVLFCLDDADAQGRLNVRLRRADEKIRCVRVQYRRIREGGETALELLLEDSVSLYGVEEEPASLTEIAPILDEITEALYFKNRNHVFTAANLGCRRFLSPDGVTALDLCGMTDYELFPEAMADAFYELEKKVLAGTPTVSAVQDALTGEGKKRWVDNVKYAVRATGGAVIGLFGVAHDVTERVETLEKLRESEGRLREVQNIVELGSYWSDLKTGRWKSSDVLDKLWGLGPDYERIVERWPAIVYPEDRAMVVDYYKNEVLAKGQPFNREYRIIRQSDGAVRWMHGTGRLEFDAEGKPAWLLGTVKDITERKETELELRASKNLLLEAQELAGQCSYSLDMVAGVWTGSDTCNAILGIDADYPHTWDGWAALVHPDDLANIYQSRDQQIGEGRNQFESEYRIIRPSDGATRWLKGVSRIDCDSEGQPRTMRGTMQDITENKLREIALRENRELLALFIEHAPAAMAMFDRDMRYRAVSRRWREMHQLGDAEMIGHSHYEFFPGMGDEWKALHQRALAGEAIPPAEELLEYHGRSLWVRRELRPWYQGDGTVGGIIIFSEDVTKRRKAEVALRESKEMLQLFVENAPVAIAMFDREMRYMEVSRRWAMDRNLEVKEIIGRSHYEVVPDVPERWRETHRKGLAGERQASAEDPYQRCDGTVQWIRWEILPWRAADGSIGGIIMFYEDITERRRTNAALSESKKQLELFVAHAPAAMAMFDRQMRYLVVSERWLEEYDLRKEEILGRCHYDIIPDLPERWKEAHRRGMNGETLRNSEDRFERADGTVQWIRWEVVPWQCGDGLVGGIILFAENITKHKEIEEQLRLAASVFTHAREGIMITDPEGVILEVNDMFTRITGYTREEALGNTPKLVGSGLHSEEFYANLWRSLREEGQWSGEIWNRNKSGELFAENQTIRAVHDADGSVIQYVSLFSDITQLKKHAQQLEHMAHYDLLTGLPNRVLLADRLRQAMSHAKRRRQMLAVAYLDLDGFKAVNDKHGNDAGDRLLNALAFNMKCALREGDTLARLGGDEFVAVILDLDGVSAAMPILEQLREAAAEPVQSGEIRLGVSASIGVTFYPQTEELAPDRLVRQADQAMYQAKLAGGNRYHIYNPDYDLTVRGRHENLERIRQGLTAGEFVLYYQPKVNMRTGQVVGMEALIRWQHPERGLLPPGMFLPVIEDHPLAVEVGEWVIDTALAQMESWRKAGLELPVSVNVGAVQLQQPEFVDRLSQLLAAHPAVKPFNLQIEVLETSALRDVAQTSQVLNACHSIGVSFALDDFGTGYSSLTYLKRLPANVLKIDQSFVSDMLEDPENLNILEGILSLAGAFHREVIAEGVETVEHGQMLLHLGCELAQGYGIARPMPADEVLGWVRNWRPDERWACVPRVHSGNKALLSACVEHRAWLTAFEAFLGGKRHAPPPMDQRQCRFGKWLEVEQMAGRGDDPNCRQVEVAHRHLHEMAAEILLAHTQGRNGTGTARVGDLHQLCDQLLEELDLFRVHA